MPQSPNSLASRRYIGCCARLRRRAPMTTRPDGGCRRRAVAGCRRPRAGRRRPSSAPPSQPRRSASRSRRAGTRPCPCAARGAARSPAGRRCCAQVSSSEPSSTTITLVAMRECARRRRRGCAAPRSAPGSATTTLLRSTASACVAFQTMCDLHPQRASGSGVQQGRIIAQRERVEQRQHRRHRVAGGQSRQRAVAPTVRAHRRSVTRRRGVPTWPAPRQHQRAAERAGRCATSAPAGPSRSACRSRPAARPARPRRSCSSASSRPCAKLASKALIAVVALHAAGADGPVAGGGVVHRVVELGRRHRARVGRQRRAHVVVDARSPCVEANTTAASAGRGRRPRTAAAATSSATRDRCRARDGVRSARAAAAKAAWRGGSAGARRRRGRRARDVPARQVARPEGRCLRCSSVRVVRACVMPRRPCRRPASSCCRRSRRNCSSHGATSPRARCEADLRAAGRHRASRC